MTTNLRAHTTQVCTLGNEFDDRVYRERLDADIDVEVREKLGPTGLAAIKLLISLHRQGYLDVVAMEDGELTFYAAERDYYFVAERAA
jgi:hypothetical protein